MTDLLCLAAHCRTLGQHATDCTDQTCRGCLPRRAADGLRLCEVHTDAIGHDAVRAGDLHGALAQVLTGGGGGGPKVSGGSVDKSLNLNERAVTVRDEIRATLVSWCLMVAEERGIATPDDRPTALGAFVHKHRVWLAAHGAAADASVELRELVNEARRVAYPEVSGTTRDLGTCPVAEDGSVCGGKLRGVMRRADSYLPSWVLCDREREHAWDATQWMELGAAMEAAA